MSKTSRSPSQRRSAREWSRLLEAWKHSGLDIDEFASRRGVLARTLRWWDWRFRRRQQTSSEPEILRLVEVQVDDDRGAATRSPEWEMITVSGHVLRVHHDRDGAVLERVLWSLVGEKQ